MNEKKDQKGERAEHDDQAERQEISDVEDELDARSDGEGLEAEAGRAEETGIAGG